MPPSPATMTVVPNAQPRFHPRRPHTPRPDRLHLVPQHQHDPTRPTVRVRGNRHPAYYRGLPRQRWELAAN